jgi:hypothetical protein
MAVLAALAAGCDPAEAGTPSAQSSGSGKVLSSEPEPSKVMLKTMKAGCTEPVLRVTYRQGRADAGQVSEAVRMFVQANHEFATPEVSYAEGDAEGVLLARCSDAETANRLARRLSDRARELAVTPVCGYAMSGWLAARRTVALP